MIEKYNRKRYLELLKRRSEGILSEEEGSELRSYSTIILAQIDWKVRDEYFQILKDFNNKKFSNLHFCQIILKRADLNQDIATILESNLDFSIDTDYQKLEEFGPLLNSIVLNCAVYDEDFLDRDTKISFQNFINEVYIKLLKYLNDKT